MRGMEFGILLTTVIVFALLLATIAGFAAARVLMHAAETKSPHGGDFDDR
jgi:hypothetical protein